MGLQIVSRDLSAALVGLLRVHPRQTTRELLHRLREVGFEGVEKRTVNRVLYGTPDVFDQDADLADESAPRWVVVPGAPSVVPGPEWGSTRATPAIRHKPLWQWQREALNAWRGQGFRGVVEAVTGTGKTVVGIAAIAEEVKRGGRTLVLVPTRELQAQWLKLLSRDSYDVVIGQLGDGRAASFDECDVIIAIVNSARTHDLRVPPTSLLVADECHRYGSPANSLALGDRFERRLGLSATYERNDTGREVFLDPYFGPTCFEMTYERALADKVIADFVVALVGVEFDIDEREDYEFYSDRAAKMRHKLVNLHGLPAEPFGDFMAAVAKLAEGGEGAATGMARSFLNAFSRRRALLAETPIKEAALAGMLAAIRSARGTIIFSQTITGAENAACLLRECDISATTVHSWLSAPNRAEVLRRFAAGAIKAVCAPQVLDEGVDVPEADLAIIVASSKTRRQMIQRMGRVLRKKADGRLARFALLYVAGTSEDPDAGAHDTFLSDITSVARRVAHFRPGYNPADLEAFLSASQTVPAINPRYAWRGIVPRDPLGLVGGANPMVNTARASSGVCPLCDMTVRFEVTAARLTLLDGTSPRRLHDCPRSLAVLNDLDLDSLPAGLWKAYTDALKAAPLPSEQRAEVNESAAKHYSSDERTVPRAAERVRDNVDDAPRSVLPVRRQGALPPKGDGISFNEAVDGGAIELVTHALLSAPEVNVKAAQATMNAIRIWRAVKDGRPLRGKDASGWFLILQGDLLRRGLIDDSDALHTKDLRTTPSARQVAPVSDPLPPRERRPDRTSEPAVDRQWGHCTSCGTRIANYAQLDLCARCAAD